MRTSDSSAVNRPGAARYLTGARPDDVAADPTLGGLIIRAEPWLAPVCAVGLLAAPTPLAWPAALIGTLPSLMRLARTRRVWRQSAFDLPLLLLVIGALLGAWAGLNRASAIVVLAGLLAGLILFAAAREHGAPGRATPTLIAGLLGAAVVANAALLVMVGPFLRLDHVPGLESLIGIVDRWGIGAWVVDRDWLLERYRLRASGVGALADVGLVLAVAAAVAARSRRGLVPALLTVPFFGLVLVAADNRGSMAAGILVLALMATLWRRRLLALVPVGGLAVLLVLIVGPVDRGLSLGTLAQRFWFWENSLYLAREVPLTGAGLGLESVALVYRGYFLPSYPPFSHAHNIYLQGLLEYGMVGLLGLLGLGVATLWCGWRAPTPPGRQALGLRLAAFGVALVFLTTGLTEIVMLSTIGGALAFGAFGLLAASVTAPGAKAVPTTERGRAPAPARTRPHAVWPGAWRPARTALVAGAGLVLVVAALWAAGIGPRVVARLALNIGTAQLNRAAFSESVGRDERTRAAEAAVSWLRTASTLDPDDAAIQRSLALALAANDDGRRGRAAADRAKALIAPFRAADLFQLGRAYVAIGAWGDGIRAWQAAGAAPQLLQLGNRLIRARNFDQAANAFVASARLDPDSRGSYEGIARAAQEREMSADDAVRELEPLMAAGEPTAYGARLEAARVYRAAGRLRDANRVLWWAEELRSGPDLSLELGLLLLQAGRPDHAEPQLARATTDLSYDPEGWTALALAQYRLGRHADAVATVQRALMRLDPSGQFAPPAERLPETAAVRADQIKRQERAPLLGVMGESLLRLGRPADALPPLAEAVAARPNDPRLRAAHESARAAVAGTPPNLIENPGFAWTGGWAVRTPSWWDGPSRDNMTDDLPTVVDGQLRLAPTPPESRVLVQEVRAITPPGRYRLTARVRAEGLGDGAAVLGLHTQPSPAPPISSATISDATWTTVTRDVTVDQGTGDGIAIVLGLSPSSAPGATVWCDDVSLTLVGASP